MLNNISVFKNREEIMKKVILLILIISAMFVFSCKKTEKIKGKKVDTNNLLQQTAPKKGEIDLEVKKVLSFDLTKANPEVLTVNDVMKGSGNYYFTDANNVKIYKYDNSGKFVKSFLRKGQGPGELTSLIYAKLSDNNIITSSYNKIIKFDSEGKVISQKKINKSYYPIEIVDEKSVIGERFNMEYKDKDSPELKIVELFNMEKEKAIKLASTKYSGQIVIPKGRGYIALVIPSLSPGIIWTYDRKHKIFYYAISNEYRIHALDLKGKELFTFGKISKPSPVDKDTIIEKFGAFKEGLKKVLPENVMPIGKIKILLSGYIAVYNGYSKAGKRAMDIFDYKGKYLYRLKLPEELVVDSMIFFNDGNIGTIKEEDKGTIFLEYKVLNKRELFAKKD